MWNIETGRSILNLKGHVGPVKSVCVSFDGRFAISGGDDQTVKLWDLATGKCVRTLESHAGPVTALAFNGTLRSVVSASNDKTIRLHALKFTYSAFPE